MICHSLAIDLGSRTAGTDALGNVEDDAGEPILVDPHFLVVWNLSELAI